MGPSKQCVVAWLSKGVVEKSTKACKQRATEQRVSKASIPGLLCLFTVTKAAHMERVTGECLIKSQSLREGANELVVPCNILAGAMECMWYAGNTIKWPEEATHPWGYTKGNM